MRDISSRRRIVEDQGGGHSVKRGWLRKFHFENLPRFQRFFERLLKITHTHRIGQLNALKIKVENVQIPCNGLAGSFDGMRILFISDLHIDGSDELADKIVEITESLEYDLCLLGGDYTFNCEKIPDTDHSNLKKIVKKLVEKTQVLAVLGNHDHYCDGKMLHELGAEVLVNENIYIEKGGEKIYFAGIDDSHYYQADNIPLASTGTDGWSFKVMLSHSPERYKQAVEAGYGLYLSGHTHGGQVCLPGGKMIVKGASVPKHLLKGQWKFQGMTGYTSRGVGTSGVNVRFFCKPEITLLTLRKK